MITKNGKSGVYMQIIYLWIAGYSPKPVFIETMNELRFKVISRIVNNDGIYGILQERKRRPCGIYNKLKN